jgi:hypothetical protein
MVYQKEGIKPDIVPTDKFYMYMQFEDIGINIPKNYCVTNEHNDGVHPLRETKIVLH